MDAAKLRTLQIVVLGLVSGVAVFAAVAFLINPPKAWTLSNYAGLGIVAGALAGLAGLLVPGAMTRGLEHRLRQGKASLPEINSQLHNGYAQKTLVGAALVESGCFLNLVFNFIEPNYTYFAVTLLLLAMMILFVPTSGGIQQWMAARRESITGRQSF